MTPLHPASVPTNHAAAPNGELALLAPFMLGKLALPNRIMVSPMCQYASESDAGPTDYHLVHLGQFAMGGAGLIFCEETAIEDRGRKSYHCAGIYDDKHLAKYRRIKNSAISTSPA